VHAVQLVTFGLPIDALNVPMGQPCGDDEPARQ
jgi:hypothetical protein